MCFVCRLKSFINKPLFQLFVKSISNYLAYIDKENPDIDVVFALRKHILSQYKSLERVLDRNRSSDSRIIDLYVNTHLVVGHANYLAEQTLKTQSIDTPYQVLSTYGLLVEQATQRLAQDFSEENLLYSDMARKIFPNTSSTILLRKVV